VQREARGGKLKPFFDWLDLKAIMCRKLAGAGGNNVPYNVFAGPTALSPIAQWTHLSKSVVSDSVEWGRFQEVAAVADIDI
jgi:hypothetical protein